MGSELSETILIIVITPPRRSFESHFNGLARISPDAVISCIDARQRFSPKKLKR